MSQSSYYITLSSKASNQLFKNNPAHFRCHLAQSVELEGQWEVALVEIIYQMSWRTLVQDSAIEFSYTKKALSEFGGDPDLKEVTLSISAGNYHGPGEILNEIVTQTKNHGAKINGNYDRRGNRMWIDGPESMKIKKDSALIHALGVPKRTPVPDGNGEYLLYAMPHDGSNCKLKSIDVMYIYSDCVEYSRVGDSLVPLLRALAVVGSKGETINHTYQRPYYLRVSRGYISDIEIQIASTSGEEIPFEYGETIVVLHFRKCGVTL